MGSSRHDAAAFWSKSRGWLATPHALLPRPPHMRGMSSPLLQCGRGRGVRVAWWGVDARKGCCSAITYSTHPPSHCTPPKCPSVPMLVAEASCNHVACLHCACNAHALVRCVHKCFALADFPPNPKWIQSIRIFIWRL